MRIEVTDRLHLKKNTAGQAAEVYLPGWFQVPPGDSITLVLHLHGALRAAEEMLYAAPHDAVLCALQLGVLSSPYRAYFSDTTAFPRILESVLRALRESGAVNVPRIRRLLLTSFSAGYAGIREILKVPAFAEMVDAVVLADGLHTDTDSAMMAMQMHDFCRFAGDARDGRKVMLLTLSSIRTSGYESTTSTADYLIGAMGAERRAVSVVDDIGHRTSECNIGSFRLRGYAGEAAADHMKHLHVTRIFWMKKPLLVIVTGTPCTGKTQLGKWLSQEFSFPIIRNDGIKELLYDRLGWKDREWSKMLSLASYDLLYYFLEAQLKAKQQAIVEANFKTSTDSSKMMRLIMDYQYHAIQFHCNSEERVLLERFQNRANTPEQHPGHVDHHKLDDLRNSLELGEYQPLELHGLVCEVDTTDFSSVDYRKLTQDLRAILHHP